MKDSEFMKRVAATIARNRSKRAFDRSMMHPEREWFLSIGLLILGVAFAVWWSTTNYARFNGTSIVSEDGEESANIYKGEMVTAALTLLESQAGEYTSLKNAMMNRRGAVVVPGPTPVPVIEAEAETEAETAIEPAAGEEVADEAPAEPKPEVEATAEPVPVLEDEVVAELGI